MLRAVVQRILDCGMNDIVRKRPWAIKLASHCSNLFDDCQLHIVCCTWSLLSCELPFLHKRYYLLYVTQLGTHPQPHWLSYLLGLGALLAFFSMNAYVISPHQYKETFLSYHLKYYTKAALRKGGAHSLFIPRGRHIILFWISWVIQHPREYD